MNNTSIQQQLNQSITTNPPIQSTSNNMFPSIGNNIYIIVFVLLIIFMILIIFAYLRSHAKTKSLYKENTGAKASMVEQSIDLMSDDLEHKLKHLENDLKKLREYVEKLDRDLANTSEYVIRLSEDLEHIKKFINLYLEINIDSGRDEHEH